MGDEVFHHLFPVSHSPFPDYPTTALDAGEA